MDMNALTRLYSQPGQPYNGRAAVEAVKAGNDVILQPTSVGVAFDAMVVAVRSGESTDEHTGFTRALARAAA